MAPPVTKSDQELMEGVGMLLAEAADMLKELHRRGINHNCMLFDTSYRLHFYKVEDVTPKGYK